MIFRLGKDIGTVPFYHRTLQFSQCHFWQACPFSSGQSWLLLHKLIDNIWVCVSFWLAILLCWSMCLFLCQKQIIFAYYSFLIQFEISNPSLELCSFFSRSLLSLVFCDLIQQNWPRSDGKNTRKNYTKTYLNDPDNHNGVVSQSEPEILECELQWVLKSTVPTKLVEVIEFQQSYLKSWKMMLLKCSTHYVRKFGNASSEQRTGKCQSSSQFLRRTVLKNVKATERMQSSPVLVRLWSKSSRLGFRIMWTLNFQMFKLGLEKAEEPEIKLATFAKT